MISRLWFLLFLLLIWCGFSNDFCITNIILGLFFSLVVHFLIMPGKLLFRIHIAQLVMLFFYVVWELLYSSIQVAWDILTPRHKSQSELIEVPLQCKHSAQISLLANLISLTPGTLAVDVTKKNQSIIVHIMFAQNKENIISFIKNKLESKIIKVIEYD